MDNTTIWATKQTVTKLKKLAGGIPLSTYLERVADEANKSSMAPTPVGNVIPSELRGFVAARFDQLEAKQTELETKLENQEAAILKAFHYQQEMVESLNKKSEIIDKILEMQGMALTKLEQLTKRDNLLADLAVKQAKANSDLKERQDHAATVVGLMLSALESGQPINKAELLEKSSKMMEAGYPEFALKKWLEDHPEDAKVEEEEEPEKNSGS